MSSRRRSCCARPTRFIGAVEGALDAHLEDPAAALTAAFGLFLTAAAGDPLIRAAIAGLRGDAAVRYHPGPDVWWRAPPSGCAGRSLTRWPQAEEHDAALLAECVVRLAISYATLPVAPAGMTASSIGELLGPFIDRALQLDETDTAAVPART